MKKPIPTWVLLVAVLVIASSVAGGFVAESLLTKPDFRMTTNVFSQTRLIDPNPNTAKFDLTISGINGFTGIVTLTTKSSPTGAYAELTSSTLLLGPSQTVEIIATAGIIGNYTIVITGTSGQLAHSASIELIAQGIGFSANPNPIMLFHSASSSTVTLTSQNGFSGNVSLSGYFQSVPLSVSPPSIILQKGGTASEAITVNSPNQNPSSGGIQLILSSYLASTQSNQALYFSLYVMTNQSLALPSYTFASSTNASLQLKNNEAFAITPLSYAVADSAGDQYVLNYAAPGPFCCPAYSITPLAVLIGTSCTKCSLTGNPFTFMAGNSYIVIIMTSPGSEFAFVIKR